MGAQVDRREVRSGNRQFSKGNWQRSEIDYRKALVKDTASFAASYNLAGALYRQDNFEEAGKSLEKRWLLRMPMPLIITTIWVMWPFRKKIGQERWTLISSLF